MCWHTTGGGEGRNWHVARQYAATMRMQGVDRVACCLLLQLQRLLAETCGGLLLELDGLDAWVLSGSCSYLARKAQSRCGSRRRPPQAQCRRGPTVPTGTRRLQPKGTKWDGKTVSTPSHQYISAGTTANQSALLAVVHTSTLCIACTRCTSQLKSWTVAGIHRGKLVTWPCLRPEGLPGRPAAHIRLRAALPLGESIPGP